MQPTTYSGTGAIVRVTNAKLTTPDIGEATATSITTGSLTTTSITTGSLSVTSLTVGEATATSISTAALSVTGLTDGKIPYHVNDATGFADGPTKTDVDDAVNKRVQVVADETARLALSNLVGRFALQADTQRLYIQKA